MRRLHTSFVVGFFIPLFAGGWSGSAAAATKASVWIDGPGHKYALLELSELSSTGREGFALLSSAQTGITFANRLPEQRHLTNQILLNGSGVAAGDVNGDGWCDLFFCGLSSQSKL